MTFYIVVFIFTLSDSTVQIRSYPPWQTSFGAVRQTSVMPRDGVILWLAILWGAVCFLVCPSWKTYLFTDATTCVVSCFIVAWNTTLFFTIWCKISGITIDSKKLWKIFETLYYLIGWFGFELISFQNLENGYRQRYELESWSLEDIKL